ncbi:MAG: anaerobic sulfatase maturase [Candidatus Marinimicrobia bacterium]|nr:anaerobic sulfatase maturase [Candidatus Neomarinimicrobiota bacterium]
MPLLINQKFIEEIDIIDEMKKMRNKHVDLYPDMSKTEREKLLFDWAIENLLERQILIDHANGTINVTPEEVQTESEKIRDDLSEQELESEFELIKTRLKLEKLLKEFRKKVSDISRTELRNYYKKNKALYKIPEQVHAKHIVRHSGSTENPLSLMKKIKSELDAGEDFEEVGNRYSDCRGAGLDLGYFPRGEMVPAFEEVVFNLKKGETSDIFQTEFGYHIAKVYDRRPEIIASFEQVEHHIRNNIIEERAEVEIQKFVDSQKDRYSLEYKLPQNKVKSAQAGFLFRKPLEFLLVKPAGPDCNLACDYCFYLEKEKLFEKHSHRMSDDILETMIRQAAEQSEGRFNFGWQGGEPTLMGLDFYKKAVELQKKYGSTNQFGNSLQTNGILLDEEWADFLVNNKFLVGLSIDGEKHIHDKYRKNKNGEGSWERVRKVAEMLLNKNVMVNSLSVVNDYSVNFPEETYYFLKSLGFQFMQFIPIVESDQEGKQAAGFSTQAEKYGEFLCKIFDLWKAEFIDNQPTTSIRLFDAVFYQYVGMESPECTLRKECGIYTVVEHNGDVYSCDFFVEPEWKLGNILEDNLLEMLNSEKQEKFGKMKMDLPAKCRTCEWLQFCHGGCPKDRLRDPRDQNISHFCAAYQRFFKYADSTFRQMARNFLKQDAPVFKIDTEMGETQNQISRNDPCPCGSGKKYKKCCGR